MSTEKIPHDFLLELPKTDLHVHLDGSLRIGTLIDLARESTLNLAVTSGQMANQIW